MGIGEKIGRFLGNVIVGGMEGTSTASEIILKFSAEKIKKLYEPGEWRDGRTNKGFPYKERSTNSFGGKTVIYNIDQYRTERAEKRKLELEDKRRILEENFNSLISLLVGESDLVHYITLDQNGGMEVSRKNRRERNSFTVLPTGKSRDSAMRSILAAVETLIPKKDTKSK